MIWRRRRPRVAGPGAIGSSSEPWLYLLDPEPPPRFAAARRFARRAGLVLGTVIVALLLGWGGFRLLAGTSYFRVDRVEVAGLSYLTRDEVLALTGLDTATSVLASGVPVVAALEAHPLVEAAVVTREWPRTLRLSIDETEPVALVAAPLVVAVDRNGNHLPIDPTSPVLDLPVLSVVTPRDADSWRLRLLAAEVELLAEVAPKVFAVVSEARLADGEVTLLLGDSGLRVRYLPPVSEVRLREAMIAINDAAERLPRAAPHEVDLRFEDQVVVRTAVVGAAEELVR